MRRDPDIRIFTPDPPPQQMPSWQAEWILRQLERVSGSTQLVYQVDQEQDATIEDYEQRIADLEAEMLLRTKWMGEWTQGTYNAREQVESEGWLMIANTETEDAPAPQPQGDKAWLTGLGDTPTWTTDSATSTSLIVGLRAQNPGGYLRYNVRAWIPTGSAGQQLEIWVVGDPTGNPSANMLWSGTIDVSEEGSWLTIPLGVDYLKVGVAFDIVVFFLSRTGSNSFAGDWDAKRSNGAPSSGEAWHQTGSGGTRIHYTDKDDVDRETELLNMSSGDTYQVGGTLYVIDSVTFNANDVHFIHNPTSRPQENLYTYTFTYYGAIPIDYVYIANGWSSNPNVQGLYSESGYENAVFSEHQYGVDLELESVVASPDWDFQAYSG